MVPNSALEPKSANELEIESYERYLYPRGGSTSTSGQYTVHITMIFKDFVFKTAWQNTVKFYKSASMNGDPMYLKIKEVT